MSVNAEWHLAEYFVMHLDATDSSARGWIILTRWFHTFVIYSRGICAIRVADIF